MIAKAKAISHGINAIRYITGESRNKKHPELIEHVKNQFIPEYYCASAIWNKMKFGVLGHTRMTNNVIRIEVSPAKEHTENFTSDDWARLWDDFVAVFDSMEMEGKDGKVISSPTHLKDSRATVWLHRESESGIPHLHAIVCRVDEKGNVNNDHNIHERAQKAAELIARSRGWTTAEEIRSDNINQVVDECRNILRDMDTFSMDDYLARLRRKYDVKVRRDKEGIVRGYIIKKGNAKYKASELGSGRLFTVSKLRVTWMNLHSKKVSDSYLQGRLRKPAPTQAQTRTQTQTQTRTQTQTWSKEQAHPKPQPRVQVQPQGDRATVANVTSVSKEKFTPFMDYTKPNDNARAYDIPIDGRERRFYLPDEVADLFDEEFNYKEARNWQELTNTAVSIFVGMMLEAQAQVGGGGGGSSNDLPRRKKDEDDLDWARRCANYAKRKHGIERKSGLRR